MIRLCKTFSFIFLIILFNSCSKPEAPEFKSVDNIVVKSKSVSQVTITAEANFHNPNSYNITLKEADINVLFNNKLITNYKKKYNLKIKKQEDFMVPLEVDLSLNDLDLDMISSAVNLLMGKKPKIGYDGSIKVKAYGVRIRVPVKGESKVDLNF